MIPVVYFVYLKKSPHFFIIIFIVDIFEEGVVQVVSDRVWEVFVVFTSRQKRMIHNIMLQNF